MQGIINKKYCKPIDAKDQKILSWPDEFKQKNNLWRPIFDILMIYCDLLCILVSPHWTIHSPNGLKPKNQTDNQYLSPNSLLLGMCSSRINSRHSKIKPTWTIGKLLVELDLISYRELLLPRLSEEKENMIIDNLSWYCTNEEANWWH